MAEGLAEAGADVVVVSRSAERLESVRDAIRAMGRKCEAIPTDVGDTPAVREMVAKARGVTGSLDILVANAGTTFRSPAEDFPEDEWRRVIDVNLNAVWFCSQEVGKLMVDQKRGKIVATASLLTFQGGITVPAYAASKGAVGQLIKALANDWAKYNIQVNGIAPGYFATDLTGALREDETRSRQILERIPADRWGLPEDLKGAVVYLASDASNYVTGHVLVVDGGWMGR
jgi:2-deoxy-D-gluconate 3-dehydrogenase